MFWLDIQKDFPVLRRRVGTVCALLTVVLGACSGGPPNQVGDDPDPEEVLPPARIAVSTTNTQGNLGADAESAIAAADARCNSSYPGYKALIGNAARHPGLDWVLSPNREYRRQDGTTVIGTTNENAVFTFPLMHSVSENPPKVWTGIEIDWQLATARCADWTSNDGTAFGRIGSPDSDGAGAIRGANDGGMSQSCNVSNRLYCVEP